MTYHKPSAYKLVASNNNDDHNSTYHQPKHLKPRKPDSMVKDFERLGVETLLEKMQERNKLVAQANSNLQNLDKGL